MKRNITKRLLALLLCLMIPLQVNMSAQGTSQSETPTIESFKILSVIKYEDYSGISYRFDETTKEFIVSENYYSYYSNLAIIEYTLYLSDGTRESGTSDCYGNFEYADNYYTFDVCFEDDELRAGNTYDAQITLTAATISSPTTVLFPIEILESPVEKIEFSTKKIIDGTQDEDSWFWFWQEHCRPTVMFKDGTTKAVTSNTVDYNGYPFDVWILTNDSNYTSWTAGNTYYTGVNIGGKTATTTLEVVENPVEKVVFGELKAIENLYGEYVTHYDEETGEEKEYFEYYDGYFTPDFTVYLKDGTVLKSDYDKSIYPHYKHIEFEGSRYHLEAEYAYGQSYDNQWKIGKNTVKASILGFETEYTVEIIENPIEKIIVEDTILTEKIDGNYQNTYVYDPETDDYISKEFFNYSYLPVLNVYFKDGTMQKSDGYYLDYDGQSYWIYFEDNQYDEPWTVGTYKGTVSVMDFEVEYSVRIKENDYTALSISGENKPVITFTKTNGETVTAEVEKFEQTRGDQGLVGGILTTDKGVFADVTFYFYAPDEGEPDYSKDVFLKIGDLTSNTLEKCSWLKSVTNTDFWAETIRVYRDYYSQHTTGRVFSGYDGYISTENIDDIITLAVNPPWGIWEYEEYEERNGLYYYAISANIVREKIKEMFGISTVDLTTSSFYNSENPDFLFIPDMGGELVYFPHISLVEQDFENDEYILTYRAEDEYIKTDYKFKITLNQNCNITKIDFIEKALYNNGDINKDGLLGADDLAEFKKQLIFLSVNNNDKYIFDTNYDNTVNILDFIRLKKNISK